MMFESGGREIIGGNDEVPRLVAGGGVKHNGDSEGQEDLALDTLQSKRLKDMKTSLVPQQLQNRWGIKQKRKISSEMDVLVKTTKKGQR